MAWEPRQTYFAGSKSILQEKGPLKSNKFQEILGKQSCKCLFTGELGVGGGVFIC